MAGDTFDGSDDKFDETQKQFVSAVAANPAKYGLTPQDATALQASQVAWTTAYPAHTKAHQDAITARETKDSARKQHVNVMRGMAHRINGNPAVDNAMRISVGMKPRAETRAAVAPPATQPVAHVEADGRFTLRITIVDRETMKRAAKPAGVHGFEIWSFVGDTPPIDPSGYTFVAVSTRSPYVDERLPADAGKTVNYVCRWQNKKGEPGPWSQVVAVKIPF